MSSKVSQEMQELNYLPNSGVPCSQNFPNVPPPPPLPPPPLSVVPVPSRIFASTKQDVLNDNGVKSTTYDVHYSTPKEEAKKAYELALNNKMKNGEDRDSFAFISSYRPVKPVIQNGPLCGMVALSMAIGLLNGETVSTDDIFAEAKKAGYSLQGEIFSAYYMQELAIKLYSQGPVKLLNLKCGDGYPDHLDREELINAFVDGHCLLVPYDADKNHGPCLANGHKAHWALVTGFFAVFDKSSTALLQNSLEREEEIPNLFYWNSHISDENVKETLKTALKSSEIYVFAHQGKSKYCGLWTFEKLLLSNNNLFEVDPERNSTDYVLPSAGIAEELRAKIVIIQKDKR